MVDEFNSVVEISKDLSNDITTYIIFISLIFLICFVFLGFQLLGIFKSLLTKIVEDISTELNSIKMEVKDLKDTLNNRRNDWKGVPEYAR